MTEDQLEQETLGWLSEVGYAHLYGPNIAYDGDNPERESYRDVLERVAGHRSAALCSDEQLYAVIREFERLTGVGLVLNTSFNENEPIVCHPQEALDCFLRTRMDMLVIGDLVISREV